MKQIFYALLILISSKSFAADDSLQCKIPQFDINKLSQDLDHIKSDNLASVIVPDEEVVHFKDTETTLKIKNIFHKVQNEVFGAQPIMLNLSTDTELKNHSWLGREEVIISVGLAQHLLRSPKYKDGEALLNFVIAHEISHTIQHLIHTPKDAVRTDSYEHQEVDIYALLILRKMHERLPNPDDLRLLIKTISIMQAMDLGNSNDKEAALANSKTGVESCFNKTRSDYVRSFISTH